MTNLILCYLCLNVKIPCLLFLTKYSYNNSSESKNFVLLTSIGFQFNIINFTVIAFIDSKNGYNVAVGKCYTPYCVLCVFFFFLSSELKLQLRRIYIVCVRDLWPTTAVTLPPKYLINSRRPLKRRYVIAIRCR